MSANGRIRRGELMLARRAGPRRRRVLVVAMSVFVRLIRGPLADLCFKSFR